jgi:hypothetical protein
MDQGAKIVLLHHADYKDYSYGTITTPTIYLLKFFYFKDPSHRTAAIPANISLLKLLTLSRYSLIYL